MSPSHVKSLRDTLDSPADCSRRYVCGPKGHVLLDDLRSSTPIGDEDLGGRCVLLFTRDQLLATLVLLELDGVAAQIVLCPPDLNSPQLASVAASVQADALISDTITEDHSALGAVRQIRCTGTLTPRKNWPRPYVTEWVLLTSGTTGPPKMLIHSLASLTAGIGRAGRADTDTVWGTFYDIRRYGGLQIFLRAILGGYPLVLSGAMNRWETIFCALASSA